MVTMEEEEEDYNQKVQQPDQDDEEEEETLSFCDLQIYSNGADDYSVSAASSSSSLEDDSEIDMFEFLSRDTSIGSSEKSIIFCGKLIAYKESEQFDETETREEEKISKRRRWSLFNPKSSVNSIKSVDRESRFASNSIGRTISSSTLNYNYKHNTGKSDASRNQPSSTKKSGFSVRKPSILSTSTRSRSRSRWNLIMFGSLKFIPSAVEMELSDIRSRQKRRNPAGGLILTADRGEEKTKTVNGLWSLIRSLGCSGGQAVPAVVPGTGFLY